MPRVEGVEQQTPDWLKMRVGVVTASRMGAVMSRLTRKSKGREVGEPSQKCLDYGKEIAYETLTGLSWEHVVTPYMDYGSEHEKDAKGAYSIFRDCDVEDGGFWLHDSIPRFGASPDGLVGEDGLVEYKVPLHGHIDIIESGVIPDDYCHQMDAELACTGRKWADFVSFHPEFPKRLRLFVKRYPRNEERIKKMEDAVCEFLMTVANRIQRMENGLTAELEASLEVIKQEVSA